MKEHLRSNLYLKLTMKSITNWRVKIIKYIKSQNLKFINLKNAMNVMENTQGKLKELLAHNLMNILLVSSTMGLKKSAIVAHYIERNHILV